MSVRTRSVSSRVIGEARSALQEAAGANEIISSAEARRLPPDLADAVATARQSSARVTVDDAVDAYARKLSRVLAAVDRRTPGILTVAEAESIRDPALRRRVLDVRAELAGRTSGGGGGAGAGLTSADAVAALAPSVGGFDGYHESGDHGVEVTVQPLAARSLTKAMDAMRPAGVVLTLDAARGADAIATFRARAESALEGRADAEGQDPGLIGPGLDALTAAFAPLGALRSASASDGGAYLFGKTSDGYVALRVVDYSE